MVERVLVSREGVREAWIDIPSVVVPIEGTLNAAKARLQSELALMRNELCERAAADLRQIMEKSFVEEVQRAARLAISEVVREEVRKNLRPRIRAWVIRASELKDPLG